MNAILKRTVKSIIIFWIPPPVTQNNLLSVTIISDSSADGDALSTTCFTLGLEKGMELINRLDNVDAIFVTDDYQLHYSEKINDTVFRNKTVSLFFLFLVIIVL